MKLSNAFITNLLLILICTLQACAQNQTTVVVRARAKDAKFIGDGMKGAMVTILNAETGDTLAHGLTKGDTGDTQRLIEHPISRYEKLSTPGAAQFKATLALQKPTLVTIQATANYRKPLSRITSSTQKWLIPGKDIIGDGVILEIPGFVITNELPAAHKSYSTGQKIPIQSHIVMMCGCSTSDGGMWDSSEYEIKARITRDGKLINEVPLSFSGKQSLFDGNFVPSRTGQYQIMVYAFHPKTGNTGVAKTVVTVK